MTVGYFSCFDLRRLTWSITLTPDSGGTVATITSDSFAKPCQIHGPAGVGAWELAAVPGSYIGDDPSNGAKYSELTFGSTARVYLNTQASGWTVPTTIDMTFDEDTQRYTIERHSGGQDQFSISFTGIGAALFGFAGSSATAATHVGTRTPLYALSASSPGLSADTGDQTPGGQSTMSMSDSGAVWSAQARTVSPIHRDWEQRFEAPEKVWTDLATTSHPWNFQDLYALARSGLPFCVRDSRQTTQGLYLLRKGEDAFTPQPHGEGNHAQLMVPFRCLKLGTRSV